MEATTLDTYRNNCTPAHDEGGQAQDSDVVKVSLSSPWASKARRKMLSYEVACGLMQHMIDRIMDEREATTERGHNGMSHEDWVVHRIKLKGKRKTRDANDLMKWYKRYEDSVNCCSHPIQHGHEISMVKCRQRWCITCNRTRAAKAAMAYKEYLESLPDLHMVTLTWRKDEGRGFADHELRDGIGEMQRIWQRTRAAIQRKGYKLQGFKKIECTVHKDRNDFHPHYHILVSGREVADMIQAQWLKRMGNKATQAGQHVRTILPDGKAAAIREVLKYCFKDASENELIAPEHLHAMNVAFFGKRTHDAMGIRNVNVEPAKYERLQAPNNDYPTHRVYKWSPHAFMWLDGDTPLFDWRPSIKILEMVKSSEEKRGLVNTS